MPLFPTGPGLRIARQTVLLCAVVLPGCAPPLDWRRVQPDDSAVAADFPCKPNTDARMVTLAGARVRMLLTSCTAGDQHWALAHADVEEAARVTPALQSLRDTLVENVQGTITQRAAVQVPGMTPNPVAERLHIRGRRPDGASTTMESAVFARGTQVFQATVSGTALDGEAVTQFFEGLSAQP